MRNDRENTEMKMDKKQKQKNGQNVLQITTVLKKRNNDNTIQTEQNVRKNTI